MKAILFIFFITSTSFCVSQEKTLTNYLLTKIDWSYDYTMKKEFCVINAESGCEAAKAIYSLVKYDNKKNAANTASSLYYKHADTASNFYNYFLSPTEALNFISNKGWTLLSIYTETFSGYDNQRNGAGDFLPITTVSSRPVFCFKK